MNLQVLTSSTVLVVAATYGLLLRLATVAGLFGLVLRTLVLLSLWRYAYEVLRDVARGHRNLPPPGPESMTPVGQMSVVMHFLLFALLAYLLATTPLLGDGMLVEVLRWTLLCALCAVLPASTAIMGITNNLAAAVNPADIASVIRVLERDYLKLLLACVGLGLFTALLERVVGGSVVLAFLGEAVAVWGVLGLFLLIGSAIRAHRADFELPEGFDTRHERDERERQQRWQTTLDLAYGSIRSGLQSQGYRTIKSLLAAENDSLEIYQWTFNRMLAWEDPVHALQLAERFVALLCAAGRKIDALELFQQCRRVAPNFTLQGASAADLAAYARSLGRHRIADELAESVRS